MFDFSPFLILFFETRYDTNNPTSYDFNAGFTDKGYSKLYILTSRFTTDYRRTDMPYMGEAGYNGYSYIKKSFDGHSVYWYNTNNAGYQLNNGVIGNTITITYYYIAF